MRRIKSCPAPKKGQRRYLLKTDFNGQIQDDPHDFLLSPRSPRSRTASTSTDPASPREATSPSKPLSPPGDSPSPTKPLHPPESLSPMSPAPRERRENSLDGSDQEETEGSELLLDYQVIRN